MSRYQAVISDFGGVLTSPLFQSFAAFQEEHGIPLESLGRAMARVSEADGENPLYALERGEMTEAAFLGKVGDALEAEVGRRVAMDGFAERYFGHLTANDELIAYLRSLRDTRGLRLALLTNNVREWESRWRAMLPVDELFETVVDSAFVGMRKPDPRIYELTLERLGLPADACLFIDDFEHNCAAARELGLTAIRFDSTEQVIRDVEAALADGRKRT